jgi:hypothetical protein
VRRIWGAHFEARRPNRAAVDRLSAALPRAARKRLLAWEGGQIWKKPAAWQASYFKFRLAKLPGVAPAKVAILAKQLVPAESVCHLNPPYRWLASPPRPLFPTIQAGPLGRLFLALTLAVTLKFPYCLQRAIAS